MVVPMKKKTENPAMPTAGEPNHPVLDGKQAETTLLKRQRRGDKVSFWIGRFHHHDS
jgi:hypothetical protein